MEARTGRRTHTSSWMGAYMRRCSRGSEEEKASTRMWMARETVRSLPRVVKRYQRG